MLRDDLYTLTECCCECAETRLRVQLNPAHPLFSGHFPGQPVLPGVATLTMVRECLSLLNDRPLRLSEIRDCKFTGVVDPRTTQVLEIRLVVSEDSVQAVVADGERIVLKMKAKYTSADE